MPNLLLDTHILIDAGRNIADATNFLLRCSQSYSLAISSITHMELLIGCMNKSQLRNTERFVNRFDKIKLSEPITDRALTLLRHYNLSHGLLPADALIAASALTFNIPRATKNLQDYRFIQGLHLVAYPLQP